MLKKYFILLFVLCSLFHVNSQIKPSFRFAVDFWANPFFYESTLNAFANGFNGSIMGSVRFDQFTVGAEMSGNYFSIKRQNTGDSFIGAYNILRWMADFYYEPVKWFELKAGVGGSFFNSSFNHDDTGWITKTEGGVSIISDFTFRPPTKYIHFVIKNRIDLFITDTINPYYFGSIRFVFHPYLEWINFYVEAGGTPWIYRSEAIDVTTGMFVWSVGTSIDITFPKNVTELKDIHTQVKKVKLGKEHIKQKKLFDSKLLRIKDGREGDVIAFSDIIFFPDSDKIKEESLPVLDQIAEVLVDNPKIIIEVGGYTNSVGNPEGELKLSVERSMKVVLYLAKKGVDMYQMKTAGYGGLKLNKNKIAEANRRVEIRILQNK